MKHAKPVRLETAPTRGKSVYLFFEFTINITVTIFLMFHSTQKGQPLMVALFSSHI